LTHDNGTDAVEITSLALFAIGVAAALALGRADRRRRSRPLVGTDSELARSGTPT
jgi:hypothetical protein